MRRLLAFGCLFAVGCRSDLACEPGPWHTERWSDAPPVIAQLRDGCGFPDMPIDYRILARDAVVLEGSLEHFNRRHELRRLETGGFEVAIWDRACIVTTTNVACREIDYRRW